MIVTMRTPQEGWLMHQFVRDNMHVICTSRHVKRDFMEGLGYLVDIWIDDHPEFILGDAL